jgi:surface-anchored protein
MRRCVGAVVATTMVAGLSTVLGAGSASAAEPRPYVLTEGHIDLFEVTYDAESDGLRLQVKDDTGIYDPGATFRSPEDVTVGVDADQAGVVLPELPDACACDFLGEPGDEVFILPMSQNDGLPWPGWSTERLVGSLPDGVELPTTSDAVKLDVEVSGPGDVHTYMWNAVGAATHHYIDTTNGGPDTIPISRNAHVHTEWAFTEPGSYTLTVAPRAETTSGTVLDGPSSEYHIQIGEDGASDLGLTVTTNRPNAQYLYGQGITLTAAPTAPTDLDHYHWFIKPAGADDFQISHRSSTAELKLPTSLAWDGAQVYANLYDDDHQVVATSDPATLHVTALEPVTTLTGTADQASYQVGETATFTATQDPATDEDHYHWYVRKPGEEFYTYIPGSDAAEATLPIAADHDGAEVIARLFNDDHAVIAESAPIELDVADAGLTETTTAVTLTRQRQQYGDRQPARARVHVQADGSPTSGGTVTVAVNGVVVARDAALSEAGAAAAALPRTLAPGRHRVVATFEPTDPTLSASTSEPATLQVRKARTATKAKLAKKRIRPNRRGKLTVTVRSDLPPTGKVVIRKGKRTLVTAKLGKAGKAVVRLPRLKQGKHRLVIKYQGNARFAKSSARQVLRVVR